MESCNESSTTRAPNCSAAPNGSAAQRLGRPKANLTDFQWLDRDLDFGEIGAVETQGSAIGAIG